MPKEITKIISGFVHLERFEDDTFVRKSKENGHVSNSIIKFKTRIIYTSYDLPKNKFKYSKSSFLLSITFIKPALAT